MSNATAPTCALEPSPDQVRDANPVNPATERRRALQTAIRRGEQLPEAVRAAVAELVCTVGVLAELPDDDSRYARSARWTTTANAYGALVAAGAAL